MLHKLPREILTMTIREIEGIWTEWTDMNQEMMTGKPKPKLFEYEREALRNLKERFQ